MKQRRGISLFALAGVGIVAIALYVLFPTEPVFRGKRFSFWVQQFDRATDAQNSIFIDPKQVERELQPFREMGPKALPGLLKMIRARDSRVKSLLIEWSEKQSLLKLDWRSAARRRNLAVLILQGMGSSAHSAAPALARLLRDPELRDGPEKVLSMFGEEAVRPLMDALNDGEPEVRTSAARALGVIGPEAMLAVPALQSRLRDVESQVRVCAAIALGQIGPEARLAVPALETCLEDTNAVLRGQSMRTLALILGPDERLAVRMEDLLRKSGNRLDAACALSAMGARGVLPMTLALTNGEKEVRLAGAAGLEVLRQREKYQTNANAVAFNPEEWRRRASVRFNLKASATKTRFQSREQEVIVPLLIQNMRDSNGLVRQVSAGMLAQFGEDAKGANRTSQDESTSATNR